jgi:hypothetical protein
VPTGQPQQQFIQIVRIAEGIAGQAPSSKRNIGWRDYLYYCYARYFTLRLLELALPRNVAGIFRTVV